VPSNVNRISSAVTGQGRANLVQDRPVRVRDLGGAFARPLGCSNDDLGSESQAQPDARSDISQRENSRAGRCGAISGGCASADLGLDNFESGSRQEPSDEHQSYGHSPRKRARPHNSDCNDGVGTFTVALRMYRSHREF
jgi:hypothetical protein